MKNENIPPKVIKTKLFLLTVDELDDGATNVKQGVEGFTKTDLLGFFTLLSQNIIQDINNTLTIKKTTP